MRFYLFPKKKKKNLTTTEGPIVSIIYCGTNLFIVRSLSHTYTWNTIYIIINFIIYYYVYICVVPRLINDFYFRDRMSVHTFILYCHNTIGNVSHYKL